MPTDSTQALEANGHSAVPSDHGAASTHAGMSRIAREFQNLILDIEDLMQSTTSPGQDDVNVARAKAKLHARVAAAKESVQRIGVPLAGRARNAISNVDGFVRERSWQVLGVAVVAGLLGGYLLGRAGGRRVSP